jgi:hypothetical protein
MNRLSMAGILAWSVAGVVPVGCAQQPEKTQAPAPRSETGRGEFATADELLTALEKADAGMVTLTADIVYDRTFEIQGDRQLRKGKLYFENRDPRRFAVQFDELWIGDVVRKEKQVVVFDGEWFVEKNFGPKQMIKRQVVAPGQKFDPLKIGEGPLPIPIGQKKADVMMRFVTTMLPEADGLGAQGDDRASMADANELKNHVEGATQVRLEPKPEFVRETDFKEIRLWYRRDKTGNLLPVMARTISRNMDVSVVRLSKVQVQMKGKEPNAAAAIPADVMNVVAPPSGWEFRQESFHRHVEDERK